MVRSGRTIKKRNNFDFKTGGIFMKEHAIAFLTWVFKNSTPRTTSRNNIYKSYWQLSETGLLYTTEELYDYWIKITK